MKTKKKLQKKLLATSVVLAAFGMHHDAKAWGSEGHAMVADMAEIHLHPTQKAEAQRLLKIEGFEHLDDISSWADDYRAAHPETGPGHFVDIPLDKASYDESRDCHYDDKNQHVAELTCVVAKLPFYVKILADKTQSDNDRLQALKWVVHFAGDINQPLHAEDHDDKGGNDVHLSYYGKETNLHAIWDGGIIEHQYSWKLGPNFSFDHQAVQSKSAELDQEITAKQRHAWTPTQVVANVDKDAVQWANGTHHLAPAAYKNLPAEKTAGWEDAYQQYSWPVIKTQLEIASVRLSEILNETLK